VGIGKPLPFRRTEHVLAVSRKLAVIESRCPFCTFVAAATDRKFLAIAEAAHHCTGVNGFLVGKKPPKNVR
jgi:hypothetical protein